MQDESILRQIADNKALFDAVKDVIRKQFLYDELEHMQTVSDERIGQITRARIDGLRKVEDGFGEIAKHKTSIEKPEDANPAR